VCDIISIRNVVLFKIFLAMTNKSSCPKQEPKTKKEIIQEAVEIGASMIIFAIIIYLNNL
jgi:hypothetical protein